MLASAIANAARISGSAIKLGSFEAVLMNDIACQASNTIRSRGLRRITGFAGTTSPEPRSSRSRAPRLAGLNYRVFLDRTG